ncbi:hypothetical protein V8E54_002325 [Elaphomyces granulatus]|jgi:hypothetical protein
MPKRPASADPDPIHADADADVAGSARPRKQRVTDTAKQTAYIKGLDTDERVTMILRDLREKHRWSIKDFLYHMVTAKKSTPNTLSTGVRASRLAEAIEQEEVAEALLKASKDFCTIGTSGLVRRIQKEVQRLGSKVLGEFDPDTSATDPDISSFSERIPEVAPELSILLTNLLTPTRFTRTPPTKDYSGPLAMICLILTYTAAPRKYNNLATSLGIYMLAHGTKRRVISVLAGLGIIPSYSTVNKAMRKLADIGKATSVPPADQGESADESESSNCLMK